MRRGPKEWIKYQMGIIPRSLSVVDGRIFFYNWLSSGDENDWMRGL